MNKLLIGITIALVVLSGLAASGHAVPCRPGAPSCRRPHPPPAVVTTIFQRVVPAPPPAMLDAASLARLLAGSVWTRLGSREQIRFVAQPGPQHFARPPDGAGRDRSIRAVRIDLVRDRHVLLVNIDASLYAVTACEMPRSTPAGPTIVLTTCLEHRDRAGAFGGQGYGGR